MGRDVTSQVPQVEVPPAEMPGIAIPLASTGGEKGEEGGGRRPGGGASAAGGSTGERPDVRARRPKVAYERILI